LKFTRLRVLGFKSFVEPTEFVIEAGLTGVVGPNGCGKSNLVEALRWVMGESSYKNMRAAGMDDVIFQGSTGRPARNTAEVSLSVENSEHRAPAAFNDASVIEITRRIEREAGSVYRINGRDVRARDVQLLFADASTGAHSPAIVGQGRVGELIAAKPIDRRALLEEAAGIAGLHNRRHEAELRLRAAEQNLARVDDVIAEIEQQFDALKRQARQATRYRNLSGHIRKAEATVLHLRWLAAGEALAETEVALAEAGRLAGERGGAQASAARTQAEAAARLPDLRNAAASAAAAVQRIRLASETLDSEHARVSARLDELDRRLAQLADDIGREERMIVDNRAILARLDDEEKGLEAANSAMAERQASAATRRRAADGALATSEGALAALTGEHAENVARRSEIERMINEAATRGERLDGEIETLVGEMAALADHRATATTAERRSEMEHAEHAFAAREQETASAEQALAAAREAAAAARDGLAAAERALGRMETESATIAALVAASGGAAPLIDAVTVAPGLEAALAAAFGDDLDAPADEDAPAHWHMIEAGAPDPALPPGVEPLSRYVAAPAVLKRRLDQTGVVEPSDGRRLQGELRPGQRLVSRQGDLWRWDGYVSTAEAPRSAAQRLAGRNRLAELAGKIEPARAAVAERQSRLEETEEAVSLAAAAERAAREDQRRQRRAVDEARAALAGAEREEGRIAARRGALEEALARLTGDRDENEAAVAAGRAARAAAPDPAVLSDKLAEQRRRVEEDRAVMAEARAAVEGFVREAEMRSGRLAAIAVERQTWHERATNAEGQIATLAARHREAEAEKEALAGEPERIEGKRQALVSEIAVAEAVRAQAAEALAAGETALAEADKVARAALEALAEAREQRGRAEERVVAARQRLAEVAERIGEALDCAPEEVAAVAEFKPDQGLPDLADIEARLERYRQERERLGAVNLRAEAEAAELGGRRDKLVGERDDLIAAIQRLRQGIASLNREGRQRLSAAFVTVNDHFGRLFTHLFGGGGAELQLTDSDDPLEAGLEIMARPPGKKPQTMTLLSGGEQALTALSLIFAVFLTNPAPICVLDEVDSPLDDANVERFCDLLDEMARDTDTRFLVVTHNPITMARMQRLFGVTMAERGVSQLVSVDLETAERFREAG